MNIFEILAECSIALAGFGAVHAVLHGSTGPRGSLRAWFVVAQGGLALILSLLPLVLDLAPITAEQLWRIAGGFGAAGVGAALVSSTMFDVRLESLGHPPQAPWNIRVAQFLNTIAVVAMFSNLLGWPWSPGALPYATAIFLLLFTGMLALLHSFMVPLQLALRGEDSDQAEP